MIVKKNGEFSKFSITVEFETADEAGAFYALFNHADVCLATVGDKNADKVKDAVMAGFGGNFPPYQPYHQKLCKTF